MADLPEKSRSLPTIDQVGALQPYTEGQELIPWQNCLPVCLPGQSEPTLLPVYSQMRRLPKSFSRSYTLTDPQGKLYIAKQVVISENLQPIGERLRRGSMREGKIAQMLKGIPGIPKIIARVYKRDGYGEPNSPWYRQFFSIYEYIDHQSPYEVMTKMNDNPEWAISTIFVPLLDILSEMHHKGIAHADIKPKNLLLTPDDQLYLTDYDISAIHHEHTTSSQQFDAFMEEDNVIIGSLGYVDPRLRIRPQGEPLPLSLPDAKSDLYAVGMMLTQCVTRSSNRDLIRNYPNSDSLVNKFSEDIWEMLQEATVPFLLSNVIMKAITHKYESADEMKDELADAVKDRNVLHWLQNRHTLN